MRSRYETKTATKPQPATSTCASADQRSRNIASATIAFPSGDLTSSSTAHTPAARKPAAQRTAETARRGPRGTSTATKSRSTAAVSSAGDRPAPALLERAGEDQELTGEHRRQRHGEVDDPGGHEHGRERGPPARHAAEQGELARRRAPLDHPREQEERGRDQAVVHHLQH